MPANARLVRSVRVEASATKDSAPVTDLILVLVWYLVTA
jgi:hypothetical protein